MSALPTRMDAMTKFGAISSMWEMDEDARREAIIQRASRGAAKALRGGRRDVIVVAPTQTAETKPPRMPLPIYAPEGAPLWKRIVYEVAIKHNIPVILIMGNQRTRDVVAARHEVYYRLQQETNLSIAGVGRKMNRDHTTILAGMKAHLRRVAAQKAVEGDA